MNVISVRGKQEITKASEWEGRGGRLKPCDLVDKFGLGKATIFIILTNMHAVKATIRESKLFNKYIDEKAENGLRYAWIGRI